ncbi:A-kinase-interacting protein 1 [Centropristis striata]|uniref:A-kinase-interacting protein 1 n=1 Tax=Centropristis striata TaxID=184440 RepID=UPI0027DFC2A8|nr:A-kinase-interacting protein 1 [Centropristis striata]
MEGPAWLDSSLRRSASLGLEVLQRASRRSVDWTSSGASQTPEDHQDYQTPTRTDEDYQTPNKGPPRDLDQVFETIVVFMTQMSLQCQRFYESGSCGDPSDSERTHVSRFHSSRTTGGGKPARCSRNHAGVSAAAEDFHIEVSPGTYAVTASASPSTQQTQLVSVTAGQSVQLTFDL